MIIYLVSLNETDKNSSSCKKSRSLSEKAIKNILANELDISEHSLSLKRNAYGKPFLLDNKRHFNISYSKNVLMVATYSSPIGIEVEYTKQIDSINSLINYFSPEEKTFLYQLNDSEKIKCFYQLWVLKESYVKAIGKGLSCPFHSFYIELTEKRASLIYTSEKDLDWSFKSYLLSENYSLAICAKHDTFPNDFIYLDIN